jgi:hypothetical protein
MATKILGLEINALSAVTATSASYSTTATSASYSTTATTASFALAVAGGGLHIPVTPVVGRNYSPMINAISGTTTAAARLNGIILVPFLPLNTLIANSFSINVTTTAASSLAKILVFDNVSGNPKNKLFESVNLDCSTSGIKTVSGSNFSFLKGNTYWIGTISNQVGAVYTGVIATSMLPISCNSSTFTGNTNFALLATTYSFSSIPSSVTDTDFFPNGTAIPMVQITAG